MSSVAIWYMRHFSPGYRLYDNESEAATAASYMDDGGQASVSGVQFSDGRVIDRDAWAAYREAVQEKCDAELRQLERQAAAPPVPKRKILDPFGGRELEIETAEPGWLGKQG